MNPQRCPSRPSWRKLRVATMIGRTIAHYQITGKLGTGGMVEVYLATDSVDDRTIARSHLDSLQDEFPPHVNAGRAPQGGIFEAPGVHMEREFLPPEILGDRFTSMFRCFVTYKDS